MLPHGTVCSKTVPHIPECTKEKCGYKWQKTPEAINGSKTKMFLGQQFPAIIGVPRQMKKMKKMRCIMNIGRVVHPGKLEN